MKKKPEFWTTNPDAERLYHTDIDDAVQECLDNNPQIMPGDVVRVYGFAPKRLSGKEMMDLTLDFLDEYVQAPEETPQTESLLKIFNKLAKYYRPNVLEQVAAITVKAGDDTIDDLS